MEHRTLEIDAISAKDLNNVNLITKMDVYAVVSISGDAKQNDQKAKTPVDHEGNNNPTWNFTTKFTLVDDIASNQNRLSLVFKLRCQRALGDKDIGEVHVPIKELLDSHNNNGSKQFVSYQVRKPSGKPKGQLSFSYQFGDKISTGSKIDEPVTAYPAVTPGLMTGSTSVYPPPVQGESGPYPPQGYGYNGPAPPLLTGYPQGGPAAAAAQHGGYYGYPPPPQAQYGGYPPPPPPAGYGGYPPQSGHGVYPPPLQSGYGGGYPNQSGHGYPPVQQQPQQQQKQKKSKFGLGLGAGLLGGALGGMLIGDALSDGCGFDGGFDF